LRRLDCQESGGVKGNGRLEPGLSGELSGDGKISLALCFEAEFFGCGSCVDGLFSLTVGFSQAHRGDSGLSLCLGALPLRFC
jgi:hypothetical protein